ncbi:hypothetical protein BAUCODRAFT_126959 [Baudoinia panamericana UAMH 10762]|uniref:Uncharacterized protein n=1 Tax=Baudoinia panamericana (strain UAMH 10762) TaxID=717646 RepID=M2M5U0_BAUPA|nr:uncharacterized protein BAUCODRAFT_126959 [Baudoinia panamericana UAMH 10762]EMC91991.1 hypothetical protein BAUCODRAFT_126959 [Baudoinia panamericana UAMH 10762]
MSDVCSTTELSELMILVKMLARARLPYRPQPTPWHMVLDSLSWLCDDKRAGKSVTSIGVQQTGERKVFLLAINEAELERAGAHLQMILQLLAKDADSSWEGVEDDINDRCVARSFGKITFYARVLHKSFAAARDIVRHSPNQYLSVIPAHPSVIAKVDTLVASPFLTQSNEHLTTMILQYLLFATELMHSVEVRLALRCERLRRTGIKTGFGR